MNREGGQITGWTEYVESEWDEEQQANMLALAELEATRCPACGGDPAECQGAENEFRWKAEGPSRCHRVRAMREREREFLNGKKDEISDSLLFRMSRRG